MSEKFRLFCGQSASASSAFSGNISTMHEFSKVRTLTAEDLEKSREHFAKMSDAELAGFYESSWYLCQMAHGKPPHAPYIQQLVQAWRELAKRDRKSIRQS
jgi:hypothetical protein